MKQVKITGFTTNTTPDTRPAMCIFGEENTGKSRFGCTAPHDDGMIGWLALDKNSKAEVDNFKSMRDLNHVLVNKDPFISSKESIRVALNEKPAETMKIYTDVVKRAFEAGTSLAAHPDVESIVVDNFSQLCDWIMFSHFGRKNQIDSYRRGAPNQDMIDFISALGTKNLVLIHRAAEIWKDEVDAEGKLKGKPTGKFKPDGFNKIGAFVTATIKLEATRKKVNSLEDKYRAHVVTCKGNTLLEGQDLFNEFSIAGESITWDNIMAAIRPIRGEE